LALAWISPGLGQLAAWLSQPFSTYTIRAVTWFGSLDFPQIHSDEVGIWLIIIYYLCLTIPAALPGRFKFPTLEWKPTILTVITGIAASLLIQTATRLPNRLLQLTISGDRAETILIQTPSNQYILINGMKNGSMLRSFLDDRLPFYDRIPDSILILPSKNRPDGLKEIPIAKVDQKVFIVGQAGSETVQDWIGPDPANSLSLKHGDQLDLGNGITLKVLAFDEESSLTRIIFGKNRIHISYGELKHPEICMANILISDQAHTECANTQVLVTPARDWNTGNHIDISSLNWVRLRIRGDDLFISAPNHLK
jgi:hypothetical protein